MNRRIRASHAEADLERTFAQLKAAPHKQDMELVYRRWNPAKLRTEEHNRTQQMWMADAERQGDMRAEEYRGYCKLHFGIPILRAENEEFREKWDRLIRDRDYTEKLEMMMAPLDFPVTRLMNPSQMTRYMDLVRAHFEGLGFRLRIPPDKRYDGYEVAA